MDLDQVYLEFLNSYENKHTRFTYGSYLKNWLEFIGLNGKEILEKKRTDTEYLFEKKIVEFRKWLSERRFSEHTTKTAVACIRAFFVYHRTPLQLTRTEKERVNKAKRITSDYKFTTEDLQKMSIVADLQERYVLLCGKSFGLRASDFITFTYGTFRSINLDQETPIGIGEITTIKEGVPAYPFLDYDAIPVVKAILETNQDKKDHERILKVKKDELAVIIQRLSKKASIHTGDKVVKFHCLRKFLIDRLSAVMSESKWKQVVGKQISEGSYVSEIELREAYSKVMKMTCIFNGSNKISNLEEALNLVFTALRTLIEEQAKKKGFQIKYLEGEISEGISDRDFIKRFVEGRR